MILAAERVPQVADGDSQWALYLLAGLFALALAAVLAYAIRAWWIGPIIDLQEDQLHELGRIREAIESASDRAHFDAGHSGIKNFPSGRSDDDGA